jgi:hypothetical protein
VEFQVLAVELDGEFHGLRLNGKGSHVNMDTWIIQSQLITGIADKLGHHLKHSPKVQGNNIINTLVQVTERNIGL